MVPYFEQPSLSLGFITLHAFGLIVAAAVLAGIEVGRRRLSALGWTQARAEELAWYVVVGGFLGAHWFSLVFYFPEDLRRDPLSLLRFWEDLSSFGSMVGGLAAVGLFLRRKASTLTALERWQTIDVVVYAFAIALAIGRLACTVAHDHPGTVTTFPLAISLQSEAARAYITDVYAGAGRLADLPAADVLATMGFHDLGWYELLYLAIVVTPVMMFAGRGRMPAGAMLVLFVALYMPVRFGLDFLRVSDARYAGLTPAQWSALAFLAFAPVIWWRSAPRLSTSRNTTSRRR